jgi:hypothetical protein
MIRAIARSGLALGLVSRCGDGANSAESGLVEDPLAAAVGSAVGANVGGQSIRAPCLSRGRKESESLFGRII